MIDWQYAVLGFMAIGYLVLLGVVVVELVTAVGKMAMSMIKWIGGRRSNTGQIFESGTN